MSALSQPNTAPRSWHVTCSGCGTQWRSELAPPSRRCPRCHWPLITRTWSDAPLRSHGGEHRGARGGGAPGSAAAGSRR
jgi:hypothetical protein